MDDPEWLLHGLRDSTMLAVAYRHGLRVSELCSLRWDQVALDEALLHVRRCKNGRPSTHPLHEQEVKAFRQLQQQALASFVFTSERQRPIGTSTVRKIVARAGKLAGLPFPVYPHMLRHATGYKLVNDGQDTRAIQHYLGHKNIAHTVRYTELAPNRFKGFWKECVSAP